jgi:nicotinate-nucleotide pyrophosphorylase (carboxylating)
MGGGRNHRYNLTDAAMLKDNHIDAYGGITNAVKALRSRAGHMLKIEVETRNFEELNEALSVGADVIMLDNMSCDDMKKCVKMCKGISKTEASGGITLERAREVAATGVTAISLGCLTHSAPSADLSLEWRAV